MHSRRFFEGLFGAFPGACLTMLIKSGEKVAGAAVAVQFRDVLTVLCAHSLRSYHRLFPNNLLYWELMRRACEEGFRAFDFGRSSPNTGPAVFKMRWGARAEQLYWHYALPEGAPVPGETSSANPRFRLASALWRRMPRAVTDLVGPRLIAHLPG